MTIGVAYKDYLVPNVSPTGELQIKPFFRYAGIRANLPETSFQIVAGQQMQSIQTSSW
jgi:hypothetical protein